MQHGDECVKVNKFETIFPNIHSRQDSNLRGETPLDFKSNALTTRPRLLSKLPLLLSKNWMVEITMENTIENI